MDVRLVLGATSIGLAGSSIAAPVRAGKGPVIERGKFEIEIALEGTAAVVTAWIGSVERMLLDAAWRFDEPGFNQVYAQVVLDGVTWRSRVIVGVIGYLRTIGSRAVGSQGIKLTLTREDFWEATAAVSVPLTNCNGTNITAGILVDNHTDSGPHQNYVDIAAGVVLGDLDVPAILTLTRAATDGMEVVCGGSWNAPTWEAWVESSAGMAGAGVTNTAQSDALASTGSYQRLVWSGAAETTLLSFTRTATWTKNGKGLRYRPAARIHNLVAGGERIWLWWRASYNNGLGYEGLLDGEPVLLSTSQRWAVFPALRIPPWPVGDAADASEGVTLQLMAMAEGAGSHTLDLDFVHFLPVDSWVRYVPVVSTVSGTLIYHDAGLGMIKRGAAALMQSHFPEGLGLALRPGVAQRLYFLARAGTGMVVDWETTVKVEYRPRRIWL